MSKIIRPDGRIEYRKGKYSAEEFIESTIDKLRKLRDDYKDELPDRVVHSSDPDNMYKCRAAWWSVLYMRIGSSIERQLLPEDIAAEYYKVKDGHLKNLDTTGLTASGDIEAANNLINLVVDSLEARLESLKQK